MSRPNLHNPFLNNTIFDVVYNDKSNRRSDYNVGQCFLAALCRNNHGLGGFNKRKVPHQADAAANEPPAIADRPSKVPPTHLHTPVRGT